MFNSPITAMQPPGLSASPADSTRLKRHALAFVLTIGVLSFFADFTYEGSRSILGPWLAVLGASGLAISVTTGAGELAGYALRLVAGPAADRTGAYWPIIIVGYVVQMASVPAMALAHTWPQAAALLVAERVGKALRNPPRDALLAHAGQRLGGYGWAFGLHEALDQAGALFGPLLVAAVLAAKGDYRLAYAALAVPAVLNLLLVVSARVMYPRPQELEPATVDLEGQGLHPDFWLYLAGAALVAAGFADYPLIAFHWHRDGAVGVDWVPVLYAIAMAVSGTGSVVFGRLYDRHGLKVLIPLTLIGALFAPLVFYGNFTVALIGAALWGLGMGVHESVIPAALAHRVPAHRRASAYGLFTAGYGVAWFAGSVVIGVLYQWSIAAMVLFCLLCQIAAVPLFSRVARARVS